MAPNPTVSPAAKLAAYRLLAGAVQLAVSAVCALYLPSWAAVAIPGLLGTVFGKLLGVPTTDVTQLALTQLAARDPDRAVDVAVTALQSLPPAQAEAATTLLLGSLPPDARARASLAPPPPAPVATAADRPTTIQFVGGTDYPPDVTPAAPTPPGPPTGPRK